MTIPIRSLTGRGGRQEGEVGTVRIQLIITAQTTNITTTKAAGGDVEAAVGKSLKTSRISKLTRSRKPNQRQNKPKEASGDLQESQGSQ